MLGSRRMRSGERTILPRGARVACINVPHSMIPPHERGAVKNGRSDLSREKRAQERPLHEVERALRLESRSFTGSKPAPCLNSQVPAEGRKTIDCAAQWAAGGQLREGHLFRPWVKDDNQGEL